MTELKSEKIYRQNMFGKIFTREVYEKSEADKVIAEKDEEIRRLRRALWLARSRRAFAEAKYNNQIAIRYRQHKERTIAECYDKEVIKWKKADRKLRAKAELYK